MDKADLMGKVYYVDNFDIIDDDGQTHYVPISQVVNYTGLDSDKIAHLSPFFT